MATSFTSRATAAPGPNFYDIDTSQMWPLGAVAETSEGRIFRYVQAGAVDLVPGNLIQASAQLTNHQNMTPTAAAAGATSVTFTLGATAVTANQYQGGWVAVTVTPDIGGLYRVLSHPAASSSASLTVTLEDPIITAWTTSTRVDLIQNPYKNVIVSPTTVSGPIIGLAVYAVTATNYGWVQTGGVGAVLNDAAGALVVGTMCCPSTTVAGCVKAFTGTGVPVGMVMTSQAASEQGACRLMLDC